jgi:hypothetical protein
MHNVVQILMLRNTIMKNIFIRLENLTLALTPANPVAAKLLDAVTAIVIGALLALSLVSWWTS